MKVLKALGILVLLLVVVIGGVFYYLFANINGIVKRGIESKGPEITTTDVDVGGVDVELFNGRAEFNNFTIANPDTFTAKNLLEAKQLVFNIEPTSLRSDVIVVNEVVIDGVTVVAEQKGLTTNIQAMLKAMKDNLPQAKDTGAAGEELRFMVERLRFSDSGLKVITEKYGEREFVIPAVEANDLGSRAEGLTASELAVAILEPYLQRAKDVAQQKLKIMAQEEVKDKAETKLREKLGDEAEGTIDKVKELF